MKNRVYIYTSIVLSLVFLATFFYFNNDGFFISGNTVNSKSLSQDSENAQIPSCENECSADSCQGFFYNECINVSGCMKKQEKNVVIGKCKVQCSKDDDCNQGQLCQNYKCNKIYEQSKMVVNIKLDYEKSGRTAYYDDKEKELLLVKVCLNNTGTEQISTKIDNVFLQDNLGNYYETIENFDGEETLAANSISCYNNYIFKVLKKRNINSKNISNFTITLKDDNKKIIGEANVIETKLQSPFNPPWDERYYLSKWYKTVVKPDVPEKYCPKDSGVLNMSPWNNFSIEIYNLTKCRDISRVEMVDIKLEVLPNELPSFRNTNVTFCVCFEGHCPTKIEDC